jgi:hypothetical protein
MSDPRGWLQSVGWENPDLKNRRCPISETRKRKGSNSEKGLGDVRSQKRGKDRSQKKYRGQRAGYILWAGNSGPTLVARGGSGPCAQKSTVTTDWGSNPRGGSHGRLSLIILMVLKEEHPVTKRWNRGKWWGEGLYSTWINPVNYLHVFANRIKLNHGTCSACSGVSHLQ